MKQQNTPTISPPLNTDPRTSFSGDIAYTILEACQILNIGRSKLYAELNLGHIKAKRCGTRRLILASELNRYLMTLPEA